VLDAVVVAEDETVDCVVAAAVVAAVPLLDVVCELPQPAAASATTTAPKPRIETRMKTTSRAGYCRPSRASRTSVTASGKMIAITERNCSVC
jgi:hypothetical protein